MTRSSKAHAWTFASGTALGFAIGLLAAPLISAHDTPNDAISARVITSSADDSPAFSCVDDGNRICGPGNAQGAPAGLYDTGGVLMLTWDQLLALGVVRAV